MGLGCNNNNCGSIGFASKEIMSGSVYTLNLTFSVKLHRLRKHRCEESQHSRQPVQKPSGNTETQKHTQKTWNVDCSQITSASSENSNNISKLCSFTILNPENTIPDGNL